MQSDLHLYYQIIQALFHIGFQPELAIRFANVALTNLGDLATPIAAGGLGASFMAALGESREEVLSMGILSGVAISLFYICAEISYMAPSLGASCGDPGEWCHGDFGDVLAFSVPLLALGILAFRHKEELKTVVKHIFRRE